MSTRQVLKKCPGCQNIFSISGYDSHLLQTTNPGCRPVLRAEVASAQAALSDPENSDKSLIFPDFDDFDDSGVDTGTHSGVPVEEGDTQELAAQEEEEDFEGDARNFEAEASWEPSPAPTDVHPRAYPPSNIAEESTEAQGRSRARHRRADEQLRAKTFVVAYPGQQAGTPISRPRERTAYETYQKYIDAENVNPYAPFTSRMDWEVARWAKMRGPGSTAVSELLQIEELATLLGLSYKNSRELNMIVDEKLTSNRPRFIRREIVVAGEVFEVYYRDVLQCIRALYGDPEFAGLLVFVPEKHYSDAAHTKRVYFDVHTGKWWWSTQARLDEQLPGATVVPTQLTSFGSKTAYPVYMTIGNLPKDVRRKPSRRGQILLAYLPSTNLKHISNKEARRRTLSNLYHACMRLVLAPLKEAGVSGINLTSGDGATRRGHPIFAMYIGDYPEQLLVTCCKNGTCPKCSILREEIGVDTDAHHPLRDLDKVLDALDEFDNGALAFSRACRDAGIKPVVQPFWADLPFVDIFASITPDLLHQLYQGVFKHLISWLKHAYGAEELDARCRRLPPNHQIRLFLKGITTLQKVTGKEHADICRILLGIITGLPLQDGASPVRLVQAVRALLDFLYLSQYPAHTTDTLALLHDALDRFHANKTIFVDLGIRQHFRLPKLHALDHYTQSIKLFGTTDNYDTQYTERLHIDFTKNAYRATNHKDELPQMTTWLERREKILRHSAYPRRHPQYRKSAVNCLPLTRYACCTGPAWTRIKITKWPSIKALSLIDAAKHYGAVYLRDALARFIVHYCDPMLSTAEVEQASLNVVLPFNKVQAFHKIKFVLDNAQALGIMEDIHDAAFARPSRVDTQGRAVPGRFDTILVNDGTGGWSGVQGYEVAQIRLIFKLPRAANERLFPGVLAPGHLAYIERFTPFAGPDRTHGMYSVTCRRDGSSGARLATVVEIRNIRRSCHLFPVVLGGAIPRAWTSSNVLDECDRFYVNPFSDLHMYMTLF
ncbi:hypothetical protein C8Q77DRAFT_1218165 [Trametes polyzona]|nr:hypothetical protein C8Q77DRAFT_1218165 [Trametes polyzona]